MRNSTETQEIYKIMDHPKANYQDHQEHWNDIKYNHSVSYADPVNVCAFNRYQFNLSMNRVNRLIFGKTTTEAFLKIPKKKPAKKPTSKPAKKPTSKQIEKVINASKGQRLDLSLQELGIKNMLLCNGKILNTWDLIQTGDTFLNLPSFIIDKKTIYCAHHIISKID